jgi:hypothetical protein
MSGGSSGHEELFRIRDWAAAHAKMMERQAGTPARAIATRHLEVYSMLKKIAILVAALSLSAPVALYAADAPATDGKTTAATSKHHGHHNNSSKHGKSEKPAAEKAPATTK